MLLHPHFISGKTLWSQDRITNQWQVQNSNPSSLGPDLMPLTTASPESKGEQNQFEEHLQFPEGITWVPLSQG